MKYGILGKKKTGKEVVDFLNLINRLFGKREKRYIIISSTPVCVNCLENAFTVLSIVSTSF